MLEFIIILIITFIPIASSLLYFQKQKEMCEKYPFFALRDKIVWEIINTDNSVGFKDTYKRANLVAKYLKELNFRFLFFMSTMADFLSSLIEKKYQEALGAPLHHCSLEINGFDKELINLILDAGRRNSFLLRFAMTDFGFHIFFYPLRIRAIYLFLKRHPEILKKQRRTIQAIQKYSLLAHCSY